MQQRNSIGQYSDFIPEEDFDDDEINDDNDIRKFSIRALNFNMMSKLSPSA